MDTIWFFWLQGVALNKSPSSTPDAILNLSKMATQQQNALEYAHPPSSPVSMLIHLQLRTLHAVATQSSRTRTNLPVGCRRWSGLWGDSPHRREARSYTLPQCACSPGGLQRKDHMLMAELWFTPHSTGEHYQAYSLSPSGAIEMDLSSMSEDICAEGDETPLSSSRFACVKVLVISS